MNSTDSTTIIAWPDSASLHVVKYILYIVVPLSLSLSLSLSHLAEYVVVTRVGHYP